jgi:L-iditol 2-dehydrogenase
MKALVLHGPGSYAFEPDWPAPPVRPGWALVRVLHAGICGSDLPRFTTTGSYHHPMILGHEFAGTVEAPASGSTRYRAGDPVAVLPIIPCGRCEGCRQGGAFHCEHYEFLGSRNDGGFAELCAVPEENLFPLPAGADLRAGAFIEPIAVALHVVRRSGFITGGSALVFGAGAIGLLVASWLRVFGATRVVVADVRAESIATAEAVGFTECWDLRTPRAAPAATSVWRDGFDAVFEAAGSGTALLQAVDHVRPRGTITVVGRDTRDSVIPRSSFERLMRKEARLEGVWGYDLRGEEAFLRAALERGAFAVAPMITREVTLEEAPGVIAAMARRESYYCKVMISGGRR